MKLKHFSGYGSIDAKKIKDKSCTLHIRVTGDHEWGLRRDDEYDLFNWLVKRFDKSCTDYLEWHKKDPQIRIESGYNDNHEEICDYYFTY